MMSFPSLKACKLFLYVVRKWKVKGRLGREGGWEFEVGEPVVAATPVGDGLFESSSNVSRVQFF